MTNVLWSITVAVYLKVDGVVARQMLASYLRCMDRRKPVSLWKAKNQNRNILCGVGARIVWLSSPSLIPLGPKNRQKKGNIE